MAALTAVVAGNRIVVSDVNQLVNLLTGVTGSGTTVTLINNAESLIFQPSSDPSAGTRVWTVKNNAGTVLASMRFDGLLKLLSAAAAPASPVTGSLYWDSLLSSLQVYNGASWDTVSSTSAVVPTQPNLVLNSDFSRRTVFGLAMPEVFADLSGTTKIDGGAAGSVGSNIFTQGAVGNQYAWCGGSFVWRDGRMSATFKATATAGIYQLWWRISATDHVMVQMNAGILIITKTIASTPTNVATQAQALTLNRWYWLEIEKQGTTFIGKVYDTGGTASGVTKASSTLLQTITATVADASVQVGAHPLISSDQAAAQWGGIATGNGGVYVETWLPESFDLSAQGTLGGQAVGFDEATDAGAIGKQWAIRSYIPAASRKNSPVSYTSVPVFPVAPSTAYTLSYYVKTASKSGAGSLVSMTVDGLTGARALNTGNLATLADAGETTFTRKTVTFSTGANDRYVAVYPIFNLSVNTTGTVTISCIQLEQGSAATAWRNAPADDAPIVWELLSLIDYTSTSGSRAEPDPRDLAANFFLPWDANVQVHASGSWKQTGTGVAMTADHTMDGAVLSAGSSGYAIDAVPSANLNVPFAYAKRHPLAAGKHRVAFRFAGGAATGTLSGATAPTVLIVTATRGK